MERNPEIYQGEAEISAQQAAHKMQSPKGNTTGRYLRSKRKPQMFHNRRCLHSADWDGNFHVMGSKNNYGCHTYFKVSG